MIDLLDPSNVITMMFNDGKHDELFNYCKNLLEKDCKVGKSLGYSGKSVIHPDQISVVHKLFHPNKSEILWAEKVCKIYSESTKKGKGATTVEGKMIDEVHFKQAKALLELVK